jgi:arylsulfatase A-like enzyme
VLFIIVDCLRSDFVYEPQKAYTPAIQKLKEDGFSFLNTIVSTSTTTPSFASLFTGLYPFEHGVRSLSGYSPKRDLVTFPQLLKQAGYNTYAEVTGPLVEQVGFSEYFEEYNCRDPEQTIHTEWGANFLDSLEKDYQEPWFILLHIWSLHTPRVVIDDCDDERYGQTLYARALASIDKYLEQLFSKIDDRTLIVMTGDHGEQIIHSKLDASTKKWGRKVYRKLRHHNLTQLHFAKAMRRFHVGHGYSIYDVLVKVPLIFYNNEIVPEGKSACQIRQIDIFPTIMDLVGISYPQVTGKSTIPIMKGRVKDNRDAYLEAVGAVIPNRDEWLAGIRVDNKYKYIYSPFRKDYKEELYFLEDDPKEKHNVAKKNQQLADKLRGKIEAMKTTAVVGEQIDQEEQKEIEDRLRDLGYIE